MSDTPERVRIDIWLWRARLFKTRALAADAVSRGAVRLTRPGREPIRLAKPATLVGPGDIVALARGGRPLALRIEALGERRGPPIEAQHLFSSLDGG